MNIRRSRECPYSLAYTYIYSLISFVRFLQAICPVCRESINCDVESLWSAPPPIDVEAATDFSVTAELRELQKQMAALYLRQQQRGGIIDLEAEGVKMLVRTEDDPAAATEEVSPPGTSLNAYSNTAVQPVNQMVSLSFGNIGDMMKYFYYSSIQGWDVRVNSDLFCIDKRSLEVGLADLEITSRQSFSALTTKEPFCPEYPHDLRVN